VLTIKILLTAATVAGVVSYFVLLRSSVLSPDPARRVAERIARSDRSGSLRRRTNPQTATGLALTLALAAIVFAGIVLGCLLLMVRSNTGLAALDHGIATWGARQASDLATSVLRTITWLGSTIGVTVIALVVGVIAFLRTRRPAVFVYLFLVVAGQDLVANLIKFAVHRARPTIDQLVGATGASFPSGHSTAAAASYAAFALVLGIGLAPRLRAMLFAAAVAITVAVGCSRMFLGVHWFTDVLAGFALGWTWFALISIAFGGRLFVFGAPAEPSMARPRARVLSRT
jgi:undecaprenyl-diphosphatase